MGLLPFRRPDDPDGVNALAAEFDAIRASDAQRIGRMEQYRREGEKARDVSLLRRVGGGAAERDYGHRRQRNYETYRHDIPLPLGKALNVKHAYRISGQLPDCIVDRRDESPLERYRSDTMEKIVWAIMRVSRGATQFSSAAWDGSELGASCFDIYYDVKRQIPVFRACDPIGLHVVSGVDDPHDFERVYRTWDAPLASVVARFRDVPGVRVDDIQASHQVGGVDCVQIAQLCDRERLVRFIPNCGVKLFEQTHNFGFVPYVVIPNIGPERDVWGWADYEFVRAIGDYISVLFSREADILRHVANGTYLDKGTGQNAELVKQVLSEGGVIPSKKDGDLSPVDPPQVPAFAAQHSEQAMNLFKMLGFAPDASWGNGFSGSAADRGLMLQPLVEFTAMKQLNWESGLGRLFGMAYQMMESKLVGTGTYRGSKPGGHGNRRLPFVFQLGSDLSPLQAPAVAPSDQNDPAFDELDTVELPRTPKELFDGDYEVRFVWNNRINPDDPAYVLSELNKFEHGAQSLETTLERLGFEAPQDEIKRIEAEAERFPWLNNGMVALIKAQLSNQQGQGGGQPSDPGADLSQATQTASTGPGGALGADAGAQGLGPSGIGQLYGGA